MGIGAKPIKKDKSILKKLENKLQKEQDELRKTHKTAKVNKNVQASV